MALQSSEMFYRYKKIPVEHFTVPQVCVIILLPIKAQPHELINKFIACSVCTVDLYAVQIDELILPYIIVTVNIF